MRQPKKRGNYLSPIGPLHDKFVLQHDQIALARLVFHECLQARAERVEEVAAADDDFLVREEPDPPQTRDDAGALGRRGEGAELFDAGHDGTEELHNDIMRGWI